MTIEGDEADQGTIWFQEQPAYIPSLEGHNGVSQNKGYSLRHEAFRPEALGTPSLHTTADFKDDQYIRKAAINAREGIELIEAGYEYLCDVENVRLFRKGR